MRIVNLTRSLEDDVDVMDDIFDVRGGSLSWRLEG